MIILEVLLIALITGLCYRMRGGAYIQFRHGEESHLFGYDSVGKFVYFNYGSTEGARIFLWALPVTLITYFLTKDACHLSTLWTIALYVSEFLLLFINLLILNHGSYQSFGTMPMNGKSTFLTFWLPQYTMTDPMWKRVLIDFIGMTIVGLGRGLIQALPLLFISLKFLWLGPAAALMGVAYLIGSRLSNGFGILGIAEPTEVGEFLTGLFYGLGLAVLALVI
jgi:hypothetical protein